MGEPGRPMRGRSGEFPAVTPGTTCTGTPAATKVAAHPRRRGQNERDRHP